MKKNKQIYFALLCLAAFVFASCEQKTDVNVQNEENRIFSEEINSHSLKTIFQHKACTDKLYADSFYKAQKSSHCSFEVICCRS